MPIADSHQSQLRDALVGAVETKRTRQRRRAVMRRVAFAVVIAAALVASVVSVTGRDDKAEASLQIKVQDGTVVVRLIDLEDRPDEIIGALRNAGLDASVELVPVGPSNVGRFVGSSGSAGTGPVSVTEGNAYSYVGFSVPQDFRGVLKLKLGRAAAPGERWIASSDAMAKGEPLACKNLYGLTVSEATRELARTSASVRWLALPGGLVAAGAQLDEPYAHWHVVDALATSPDDVLIGITADGSWPFLTKVPQVDPSCKGK